jgi:tetratricopeptide (TPR) repeat protein
MIDLVTAANDERGKERRAAMALVDAEADQLRSAVAWIGDVGDVGLATAIAFPSSWWFLTRDAHAGQRLIGRLLDLVDRDREPLAWAGIVLAVGVVTAGRPQSDLAGVTLDAVAIYDEVSHRDAGLARIIASYAQLSMSDAALRARLVGEAEQLVPAGDRWASAVVDMSVMMIHGLELLFDTETPGSAEAVARGERAVKVFRDMGETWAVGVSLSELGRIHQRRGDLDVAEARYTESLGLFDASGFHGSHYVFTELGRLTTARGDHELAQSYHPRALEITEIDGPPVCLAGALAGLGHAAEARGDLDEALDHYRRAVSICHSVDHADQELTGWEAAIDRLAAGRR